MTPAYSAYIPCFNAAETLVEVIESVRSQDPAPTEFFVVDDGSTDDSAQRAEAVGAKVLRLGKNCGRGEARRLAVNTATNELVLGCDATNILPPGFSASALRWFKDETVAAVCGDVRQQPGGNAAGRWRGRHLFLQQTERVFSRAVLLSGLGHILRKSHALQVGNFDPTMRTGEDRELSTRLLAAGFAVVADPEVFTLSIDLQSVARVFERYARWHNPVDLWTPRDYLRQIVYSMRVMAPKDLKDGDAAGVLLSLLSPHYQYFMRNRPH